LTDEDSDGEGPPEVEVADVNEFLKKLEENDNTILKLKELNKEDVFDEYGETKKQIDDNLNEEKNKWIAVMPSKTNDYNRFIQNTKNKLIIL